MARASLSPLRRMRFVFAIATTLVGSGALAAWVGGSLLLAAEKPAESATLEKPVKDFELKDVVSGKTVKLSDQKGKVVVLLWHSPNCSACPFYDERVKKLVDTYKEDKKTKDKVVLLGVNSSSGDGADEIRDYVKEQSLNFAMLKDEDASVAQYFSIEQTATFLVIDGKGVLRYRGGFDDNPDEEQVKRKYVKDAVDAVLAGKKFLLRETLTFG